MQNKVEKTTTKETKINRASDLERHLSTLIRLFKNKETKTKANKQRQNAQ